MVARALVKIGLNLLSDTCERTEVGPTTFPQAIDLVTGARAVTERIVSCCGFVRPSSVAALRHEGKHAFRILFDGVGWKVYSAFFSGRVCTMAMFPGPNRDDWCTADISEPYRTDETGVAEPWSVRRSRIMQPLSARVEHDFGRILLSLDLINLRSGDSRSEKVMRDEGDEKGEEVAARFGERMRRRQTRSLALL